MPPSYKWIHDWITIPENQSSRENGRTHGVVVSQTGSIFVFHQATPSVLEFSPDGTLRSSWGDFPGAHGMTLVEENGKEYLWLTDQDSKQVVKTTLTGEIVQSLPQPSHKAYEEGDYVPTWVAVNPENANIWVADGYGCNLVHRFNKVGTYLSSIDGSEGSAGRFTCPHGIWIGERQGILSLHIADRGNKRMQVYDLDGNFIRTYGENYLNSPDGCIAWGKYLIVPELTSRITLIDQDDALICHLGENDSVAGNEGWPNNREWVETEKFNSPHGAAVDADGNIYIAEWIIGGRITKLEKI